MRSGIDLRELGGELSYRRLTVFLAHAPRESAYVQSRFPEARWSQTDHILADLYDLIRATVKWQQAPPKYPRPGDKPKTFGKPLSFAEIDAHKARLTKEE
jgi:hypothetical protein